LEPFTTEKVYIHVYVRYENRRPVPLSTPFPFPTITPVRAPALRTQTVPLSDLLRNPCLNRLRHA